MRVYLVHGMGRSPASLGLLRRRLEREGFEPHPFGYLVSREPFAAIVERFVARVTASAGGAPYAVVGHSLGNVIARAASPRLPAGLSRLVMLAPPNRPALLARKFKTNPLFRALTREAGQRLGDDDFYAQLPVPGVPTLVLAGTAGPRARWLPFGGATSDGVVALEETRLEGALHREVSCLHTFIMNDPEVARLVARFLRDGRIEAELDSSSG